MKVVHSLGWYFPESSGGSEVYVDTLARNLARVGVDSVITAARDGDTEADYVWNDRPVHRYPVLKPTPNEIVDGTPHQGFDQFERWLRSSDAEIYHQHSWTRGCGASHLALAKRLGLKTIVTVHVPSVVCLRGTMMLNGTHACDGRVVVDRCSECWGTARAIPRPVASWLGRHRSGSSTLAGLVPDSRLRTMLLTPELVARRQTMLSELVDNADRIVAVCRWLFDALALNEVPEQKLLYCPQGIDMPSDRGAAEPVNRGDHPLRVGFLGRWNRVKGLDVLVAAFLALPRHVSAELIVHALPEDAAYEQHVRTLAAGDSRISFATPVARKDIFSIIAGFDVLAVPSQWLETGPLVVLEAFAVGRWVLGSDLGGIAELVQPGKNGRLVPAGDIAAWSQAIADLAGAISETAILPVPPLPSSARRIADQMKAVYSEVLDQPPLNLCSQVASRC